MKADNRRSREWHRIINLNEKTMEKTSIYPVHRKVYIAWPGKQNNTNNLPPTGAQAEKKGFVAYPKKSIEQVSSPNEAGNALITCKEGLFVAYPKKNASVRINNAIVHAKIIKESKRSGYVAYPSKGMFATMVNYKAIKAIFRKKVAVFNLCQLFRLKAS
jgi:hypothetical protein